MIKISRWRSCVNTPPKKDGVYLVVRFYSDGTLGYASNLPYTTEWGWNTGRYGHESVIVFKNNKYDKEYMWTTITKEKGKKK